MDTCTLRCPISFTCTQGLNAWAYSLLRIRLAFQAMHTCHHGVRIHLQTSALHTACPYPVCEYARHINLFPAAQLPVPHIAQSLHASRVLRMRKALASTAYQRLPLCSKAYCAIVAGATTLNCMCRYWPAAGACQERAAVTLSRSSRRMAEACICHKSLLSPVLGRQVSQCVLGLAPPATS